MFIYSTFFTLKHYPDKGGFYYPYFSFYTLWFVAGPCIIIIANHIIAEWVRQKVSYTLLFSMIIRAFFMNVCISYQLLLCKSLFSALFPSNDTFTLHYLINVGVRLLIFEQNSTQHVLIPYHTFINFWKLFQSSLKNKQTLNFW